MLGLDTNILIRFLTRDSEDECRRVLGLLNHNRGYADSIYITDAVLCELVWVLTSSYNHTKTDLIEVLELLSRMNEFKFSNRTVLKQSIELYKKGTANFTDYFIVLQNQQAGCKRTYSFDKKLLRELMAAPVPTEGEST